MGARFARQPPIDHPLAATNEGLTLRAKVAIARSGDGGGGHLGAEAADAGAAPAAFLSTNVTGA